MKILVVSDTHGDIRNLAFVLKLIGRIDMAVHCGDGSGDFDRLRSAGFSIPPVVEVRGNMDTNHNVPQNASFDAHGRQILVSHGNRALPHGSILPLSYAAKEAGALVHCFGHTHVPLVDKTDGVLLVNPGSLSRPRGPFGPSFAILEAPTEPNAPLGIKLFEILEGSGGKSIHEIDTGF